MSHDLLDYVVPGIMCTAGKVHSSGFQSSMNHSHSPGCFLTTMVPQHGHYYRYFFTTLPWYIYTILIILDAHHLVMIVVQNWSQQNDQTVLSPGHYLYEDQFSSLLHEIVSLSLKHTIRKGSKFFPILIQKFTIRKQFSNSFKAMNNPSMSS